MQEYTVLFDSNIHVLVDEVNEHLEKGYVLVGGLVSGDAAFYQAMAKEASGTTKGRRN